MSDTMNDTMNDIVDYDSVSASIEHKNRDFLNSVGDIMDDPTFKAFFECYFNDWDDCVAAVMLMKAYQSIDKHTNLSKEEKVSLLRQQMKNAEFRHQLAKGMNDFMNQHTESIKDNQSKKGKRSPLMLLLPFI